MGTKSKPNTNDEDVATAAVDGRWDSRSQSPRAASNEMSGPDVALKSLEVEGVDEAWSSRQQIGSEQSSPSTTI